MADVAANSNKYTAPTVKATFATQTAQVGTSGAVGYVAPLFFDLKPTSKYDSDESSWDSAKTNLNNDNFSIVNSLTDNICAESWVYGDSMVACVKI